MKTITSAANPKVKALAKLRSRKGRAAAGSFLVEGFSVVEEAFSSKCRVRAVILEEKHAAGQKWDMVISRAERAGAEVVVLSGALFKKISGMDTTQGVAAEVARPQWADWKKEKPKGPSLLVEELRDPRNLGLLARTALAAGAEAVFLTKDSVDPFHPFAVQVSMGAALHLPVYTDVEAAEVIEHFKANRGEVFATAPRGGIPLTEWKPGKGAVLFVLGNESRGVSPEVLELCDAVVTIPLSPRAESLNIAVTAGILCFHKQIKR